MCVGYFWGISEGFLGLFFDASGVPCWCFMVFFGIAISGVYLGVPWMFWGDEDVRGVMELLNNHYTKVNNF